MNATDPRRNMALRDQIKALSDQGLSIRQIAKAVGRSTSRVHALLHEASNDTTTKETK
ncbi:helix-turn-helix domain-containing protein [Mycobacterium sp.]|uniref:helix-turn-helix domain-containing protein n=1 Tax=Mycobacterium sp. TaxID=1785 RepID=UPI00263467E6|nr:helix-turn-helix domain-containing protein [Mycobacterium sp.]